MARPTMTAIARAYTRDAHITLGRAPDSYALYLRAAHHAPAVLKLVDAIEAYRADQSAYVNHFPTFDINMAYWRLKTIDGREYRIHGIEDGIEAEKRGEEGAYVGVEIHECDSRGSYIGRAIAQATDMIEMLDFLGTLSGLARPRLRSMRVVRRNASRSAGV